MAEFNIDKLLFETDKRVMSDGWMWYKVKNVQKMNVGTLLSLYNQATGGELVLVDEDDESDRVPEDFGSFVQEVADGMSVGIYPPKPKMKPKKYAAFIDHDNDFYVYHDQGPIDLDSVLDALKEWVADENAGVFDA